jgi:hypothetical protein
MPPPRSSGFWWTAKRQVVFHGGHIWVNESETPTSPSHDLAHVLVAMSSGLHWLPLGDPDDVRMAEYNAVLLEHLLGNAYNSVVFGSIQPGEVLNEALRYARWFVEEHYAPFPLAPEEAYRRFCLGIDPRAVSSLSVYFFVQRARELRATDRNGCWHMYVKPQARLRVRGKARDFLNLVRNQVESIADKKLHRRLRAARR